MAKRNQIVLEAPTPNYAVPLQPSGSGIVLGPGVSG